MADSEKVIKEFEAFVNGNCPSDFKHICHIELMENVLALLKEQEASYQGAVELLRQKTILFDDAIKRLKEQEAVEPEWYDGTPFCGKCGHRLEKKNRNMEIKCPTCGRSVKWE